MRNLLRAQPQHRQAGRQDRHAGTGGQQQAEVASGVDDVLEVVEDQQPPAVAEPLDEGLQGRGRSRAVEPHFPWCSRLTPSGVRDGSYAPCGVAHALEHRLGATVRGQRDDESRASS